MEVVKLKHIHTGKTHLVRGLTIMIQTGSQAIGLITEDADGKEYVESDDVFETTDKLDCSEIVTELFRRMPESILGSEVVVVGTQLKGKVLSYMVRSGLGDQVQIRYISKNGILIQSWLPASEVEPVYLRPTKSTSKKKKK